MAALLAYAEAIPDEEHADDAKAKAKLMARIEIAKREYASGDFEDCDAFTDILRKKYNLAARGPQEGAGNPDD